MNDLIRSVLDLPAGTAWPPDVCALLGLTTTELTPARVEAAVLERMERLRAYQLAYPDEVTEAMNRLARALVEAARPAPESTLDRVQPANVTPEVLSLAPEPPAIVWTSSVVEETKSLPSANLPSLDLLPELPVAPPEPGETHRPFQEMRQPNTAEPAPCTPAWFDKGPRYQVFPEVPVRSAATRPMLSPRRRAVHEVVRCRKLLCHWDAAGVFLDQPEIVTLTRAESIQVLLALGEIESASWAVNENGPGGRILSLARGRPNVGALWELPYNARDLLRADWQAGRQLIVNEQQRRRQSLQRRRPWRELQRHWLRYHSYIPPTMFIAASMAGMAVGLIRLLG